MLCVLTQNFFFPKDKKEETETYLVLSFRLFPKVVTWNDATGTMVPFGHNRSSAKEEIEGGGSGEPSFTIVRRSGNILYTPFYL